MTESWQAKLIQDDAGVADILRSSKRIAVVGIKTEGHAGQPAYYVPDYLRSVGYTIVPVPVYYPEVTEILGEKVYRRLVDIPEPIDLVVLFRRPNDVPPHVDDILAARPKAVWMQSGIRNEVAARRLAEEGILVVQDRCTMVEHRRMR